MSTSKRWKMKLKDILATKGGCACGSKATDVTEPKPKLKPKSSNSDTSTSFSDNIDEREIYPEKDHVDNLNFSKIRDSLAIVKDSKDPYQDFRQSMLQMIIEREIYSRNDLQQLLRCFLELNSAHHHEVIVRAFMELWNGGGGGGAEDGRRVLPVGSMRTREDEIE